MRVKVHILNSFIKNKRGGNPAGVVLRADNLSKSEMQGVAKKVGLPETAFVMNSKKADFKLRFFSPETEVPFCGHAALAAFFLLAKKRIIKKGKHKQETKTGILSVNIFDNWKVFINQNLPKFSAIIKEKGVLSCLNISADDLIPKLPIQIVSTGFPLILIPINSLKTLKKLKPNLQRCRRLSRKKFLIHLFTLETINRNSAAFSRNFFPIKTLDEESATGSSTGALACYLYKYKLLPVKRYKNLVFEQGYFMDRPSEIIARLRVQGNKINEIQVGGKVILKKEIQISI